MNCGAFPTQAKHFNFSKCKQEKRKEYRGKRLQKASCPCTHLHCTGVVSHLNLKQKRRVSKPHSEKLTRLFLARCFQRAPCFIRLRCCSMPDADQGTEQAHDRECRAYERWQCHSWSSAHSARRCAADDTAFPARSACSRRSARQVRTCSRPQETHYPR